MTDTNINRGRIGWLPRPLIVEIEKLKMEQNIRRNQEAVVALIKYAQVGRELEHLRNMDLNKLQIFQQQKKGYKKNG